MLSLIRHIWWGILSLFLGNAQHKIIMQNPLATFGKIKLSKRTLIHVALWCTLISLLKFWEIQMLPKQQNLTKNFQTFPFKRQVLGLNLTSILHFWHQACIPFRGNFKHIWIWQFKMTWDIIIERRTWTIYRHWN